MARFDFSFTDMVSNCDAVCLLQRISVISIPAMELRLAPVTSAHPDSLGHFLQAMHQKGLDNLRAASKETRTLCATLMDTLGPEIIVVNRCASAIQAPNRRAQYTTTRNTVPEHDCCAHRAAHCPLATLTKQQCYPPCASLTATSHSPGF